MATKNVVLNALRDAGEKGIHSFDLFRITGSWRCAARILDLKKEGYVIDSNREKKGKTYGVRYILKG